MSTSDSVFGAIQNEMNQNHSTRIGLFPQLAQELGRPVITFFTSFKFPVGIDDSDVDILTEMLRKTDTKGGFALMINSAGGDGLAAERIVNICRCGSETGEYWAIVPGKAKSAATVICMGASKVLMAPTSELGPVDPQILISENGQLRSWSADNLVVSYEELFSGATSCQGHLEPFLQQLSRYDARDVQAWRSLKDLTKDIAVKILSSGMMAGQSLDVIRKNIQMFLDPKAGTKTHGRPIYSRDAIGCGLKIDEVDPNSVLWTKVYELYMRTNRFVETYATKAIESADRGFNTSAPQAR